MPDVPALAVRGLRRSYGQFEALRGLDLQIAPGACVAVIGHNGSGKTTAVRVIAGLLEPSDGVVEVCGANVHDPVEGVQARADMAIVPDTPMLYADLAVSEHLELVAVAHGLADDELDERMTGLLERLGLESRRDSRPGELSRGLRQRVQLACALIRPFALLVLDEPVVGLDPGGQRLLRDLLLEAKASGAAVLFTTHQLEFARGLADRAVMLDEGAVVIEGRYDHVIDGETIRAWGLL
jgi:ABC-2 type transport system ATP-binding protein